MAKRYAKSKKQHQRWWKSLTLEQQEDYIKSIQAKKAKRRQLNPPKDLEYDPKYPWETEGVNSKNRAQWLRMIKKKNPWMKVA